MAAAASGEGAAVPSAAQEEQAVEIAVEHAVEQAMAPTQTQAQTPAVQINTAPAEAVAGPAVYRASDYQGVAGAAVRLGVRPSVVLGALEHAHLAEASLEQIKSAVEAFLAAPVR